MPLWGSGEETDAAHTRERSLNIDRASLEQLVVSAIKAVSGVDVTVPDLDKPLDQIGVDSIALVDVLYTIEDGIGRELDLDALQIVADGGSIAQLITAHLTGAW